MGRQLLNASSQKLRNADNVVSSLPLTLACFARSTTHANSRVLLGVGDIGENHYFVLRQFTSTTVQFSAFDGGTARNANGGLDVSGQWIHWAGVAASTTSRVCYRNGVAGTASTPSVNPSSIGFTSIGCSGSGSANFYNGIVAFPAIWNVALTAGEILQLSQGADPRTIRPQNLVAFWPLNTPGSTVEYDQNPFAPRRYDLTVTGATPAIDPPIWTPKRKQFWLPSVSTETARFYAGVSSKLWTTPVDGGSHTGTPTNGDTVGVWQDQSTPATRSLAFANTGSTATRPSWSSPGSMALPSMSFDGGDNLQLINNTLSAYQGLSAVFGSTAKMIVAAVRFTAGGTNNANIYDNTALLADSGGYFGIHLKTVSGTHTLYVYNWDGSADSAGVNISLDTDYVLLVRHDGTNINISVLSGSGGATRSNANAASGATSNMTGTVRLANSYNNNMATVKIGEIYFGNSDLGSTNSVLTDFVSRWLPSSSGGGRRRRVIICGGAA